MSHKLIKTRPFFTPRQKKVIRKIAKLQIECIISLSSDEQLAEQEILLMMHELDKSDLLLTYAELMMEWDSLFKDPELIGQLSNGRLSMFKHCLFNYVKNYPKTKRKLYRKIFLIEDLKEPNTSFSEN